MSLCETNQRTLMNLFNENVKTDISHTNDIIDLIQKKLQDFDLNLDSLKCSTTELKRDYAVIGEKITSLDTSFKRVSSFSNLSRSESISSMASSYSSSSGFSDYLTESSTESEIESDTDNELESTFVIVTKDEKTDNIIMDDQQRYSISNDVAEDVSVNIEEWRKQEYQLIDKNCNQLIDMLMQTAGK